MTLKRKRSDPELCSSPSSSSSVSVFSSPPSNALSDVNPQAFSNMPAAHLHSRTFKRHRDSRPSEEQVHQHTLNLLYSARQQSAQDVRGAPPQAVAAAQPSKQQQQQQSLHRFWSISSAAPVAPEIDLRRSSTPAPSCTCEDCGARLGSGGGGHGIDVDDDFAMWNSACGACGKHVCFSCSVSNLGDERRCLQCAGRKVWVGGVGWTDAAMSTC
ncbi:hypothetical protein C2857_007559 [Epichloe festucae Fl1]|uniref:Uncharacterized protein n=1 Tax=Epichloe festucae (strain Fl1) TaxID=877507 RepID=A0A7S9PTF5_EPIFF|nr:hypothetical protein C2857_007559 [Epichloe festucae Fl1]